MRKKLNIYIFIFCFVIVLFMGCYDNRANVTSLAVPPIVGVLTLKREDVPINNSYIGTTEGSQAVEIRAQVSGILKSREYEEGGYVKEGQLLFTIEPDSFNAALMQAKGNLAQADAKLTQAKQNYKRVSQLFAKNAVSRMDFDNAKGDYDAAKAQVEAAKAQVEDALIRLNYTTVRSPVSGYAGKANMSLGNLITTSSNGNLLTVVNKVDPIYVNFFIPDSEISLMKELMDLGMLSVGKQFVEMTYFNNMKFPHKGNIIFTDKAVNKLTADIAVRAVFENRDLTVMPGQFVVVTVYGTKLLNVILIPQESIIQTAMGSMVVVVGDDNIARYKQVELGPNIGGKYIVMKGLEAGNRIVVEGSNKVRPGSPVTPAIPSFINKR